MQNTVFTVLPLLLVVTWGPLITAEETGHHHSFIDDRTALNGLSTLTQEDAVGTDTSNGGSGGAIVETEKRAWRDMPSSWGKRAASWRDLQSMWDKRAWEKFQGSWGKKDGGSNNWNAFRGSWGKRPEPGWNNLKGLWGKRAADSNWGKLSGYWGKRSIDDDLDELALQRVIEEN